MTTTIKRTVVLAIAAIAAIASWAQGRMDMRINEVMVQNDSSYIDHYGHRSGWIELFNTSYGSNGIEQMFIATRKLNLPAKNKNQFLKEMAKEHPQMVYEIPGGDVDTDIPPRTHVVAFADGETNKGALHLSFTLTPGKPNYIALYDVNGDLVDEVVVPANLPANCTYARNIDGHDSVAHQFDPAMWSIRDGKTEATAITPGKYNKSDINENVEKFHENDPMGIIITVIAMLIVFAALLLLYLCFKLFGKISTMTTEKKKATPAAAEPSYESKDTSTQANAGDEVVAAIALALHLHLNAHDEESGVLTFNKMRNTNQGWSDKRNLLGRMPR